MKLSYSKKIFFVLVLFFTFENAFASSFSYFNFFTNYTSQITNLDSIINFVRFGSFEKITQVKKENASILPIYEPYKPAEEILPDTKPKNESKPLTKADEQKINTLIENLIIPTPDNQTAATPATTCSTQPDPAACKQGLFQSCAESFYYKTEMQSECKSFPVQDYQNYANAKQQYVNNYYNPLYTPNSVQTSVGSVTPSPYIPGSTQNTIPPSSYARSPDASNPLRVNGEREAQNIPYTGQEQTLANGNTRAVAVTGEGWIENVWGTEYCNGRDSCNSRTALGFSPQSCIVSLPYKVIDTLFGTKTYQCIEQFCVNGHTRGQRCRSGLGQCLAPYYKLVSGRMIEVKNLVNGKMGMFPLGDVGPAEWTGNMIDFTQCSKAAMNFYTGKGKFSFRPAPQGAIPTR